MSHPFPILRIVPDAAASAEAAGFAARVQSHRRRARRRAVLRFRAALFGRRKLRGAGLPEDGGAVATGCQARIRV
ncbi:hypothetical protein [Sagittula sp.]|uniref:hypothetical protein n=1 Tax=Sagittula sp. TaxID=2038081 RepID=UPI003512E280